MIGGQKGFTLIEILVAVVILAIGLLGIAGLQVMSVKSSTNANLRSVAVYLANDMADRIRANNVGVAAGNYDNETGSTKNAACLTTTGCTAAQMAANDKFEWLQELEDELPGGAGTIVNNGGLFTVTVTWNDRVKQAEGADADTSSEQSTVSLTFQP
ncbi:type IV pilus modification protein PilV [Hahella chejuensis]|uniref:type IV pilus modification protein PilV n=1 Tax=Hahella chejuensis TaxID=158327 RepID=UPI00059F1726|nr:type IV pilus modification protein PilV [Hahella chejuensis]